jgi:hypothetical protein
VRLIEVRDPNVFIGKQRFERGTKVVIADVEYVRFLDAHRFTDGTFSDHGLIANADVPESGYLRTDTAQGVVDRLSSGSASGPVSMANVIGLTTEMSKKSQWDHLHRTADITDLPEVLPSLLPTATEDDAEMLVLIFENGLI